MKLRNNHIQCLLLEDFIAKVLLHWSAVLLQRLVRQQNGLTELLGPNRGGSRQFRGLQLLFLGPAPRFIVTAAEATSDVFSMMAPANGHPLLHEWFCAQVHPRLKTQPFFLGPTPQLRSSDDVDWREGGW